MTENIKKPKILLLDDDKFLLDMYAIKFQKENFDVRAFFSGEDALNFLKEGNEVDVILFDLIMPKIDGMAFIKQVKENGYCKNARRIVLSNQGQQSDIDSVQKFGINGYIIKALHTPSQVVEEVKKFIN